MEWRDLGRFFAMLVLLLACELLLALVFGRPTKAGYYDTATIAAALYVVLRAVREHTPTQPESDR